MHPVLRIEKKFSAKALSYGLHWLSLPFGEREKIPQQFILHLQPLVLILILLQCFCWFTASLFWYTLLFFPSFPIQESFYNPFPPNPSCSAICCCVYPSSTSAFTVGSNSCTFSYFLGITTPPNVVLSFSYIRGCFVYCPFLLVRFKMCGLLGLISQSALVLLTRADRSTYSSGASAMVSSVSSSKSQ